MKTNMFDIGLHARWMLEGDRRVNLLSETEIVDTLNYLKESVDFLRGMYGETITLVLDRINQDILRISVKYGDIEYSRKD